ncbi:MAG TPA: bifunctional YncE family protein/alkaline phosphatase family protein [Chitinophagaceae bacterium]|nr:bifunctional YncE family protein/alkaline phosphatase family protein [Chitinophagaceae bacterium]
MKKILLSILIFSGLSMRSNQVFGQSQLEKTLNSRRVMLPNGWSLSPAGTFIPLKEDLPLNMAVSPSGKYVAVTNNGFGKQSITLIDVAHRQILDDHEVGKSWLGIQFSGDGKSLYASGGNDNLIIHYRIIGGKLENRDSIVLGAPWPVKISPTGLALDEPRHRIYVVTKEDSALYIADLDSRKVLSVVKLPAEAYTCVLSPDGKQLYISIWGGGLVTVYDLEKNIITGEIQVGSHPNDMVLSRDGKFLFVANANDNSVSVIRTSDRQVLETMIATLYPDSPTGSTTNGLALSPDQKSLYVANADNNCLAVFDVSDPGKSHSLGFIPVGWYPTCVRVAAGKILVSNGRGFISMANPGGPNPLFPGKRANGQPGPVEYIGSLFKGNISVITPPGESSLKTYSAAVYRNTPYTPAKSSLAEGLNGNPIPRKPGDPTPIKYIFYVIKENRTYDQVFGDLKEGNGDSSLCLFGRKVTPNEHALAEEFVLLDNFYVDATVSADGHDWSMGAYATDYTNKTWPSQYSGRGGNYDYQGTRPIAYPKEGYIWDYCKQVGISYRSYGEFVDSGIADDPVLKSHLCSYYPGWDLDIQDVFREQMWVHDFDSLVAAGTLPTLNTIYLPNDHTSGMERGAYTPIAHVADNDLALGRLVDHISHSPIWNQSAIFVLEDDAQDGPDHVDAHRSPAFVISPYVKRHSVDHTMYSTTGLVRTIELIIGMHPMSQYDAAAMPMFRCFSSKPDPRPFNALPALVDINARNTGRGPGAKLSAQFDLTHPDAVPDAELNQVIWQSVKGDQSPMPPPRRSAFVKVNPSQGKDGD